MNQRPTPFAALRLTLVALWFGAALFFSVVVAPAVFGVLRGYELANASQIAGTVVARSLGIINVSGFAAAVVLLFAAVVFKQFGRCVVVLVEVISLATMAIMTALGHWVIAAKMMALRTAMQMPIDQVPHSDPRWVAFDSLHHDSVAALGIALLAALIAWIAIARQVRAVS